MSELSNIRYFHNRIQAKHHKGCFTVRKNVNHCYSNCYKYAIPNVI